MGIHLDAFSTEATNRALLQLDDCSGAVDLDDLSLETDEVGRARLLGDPDRLTFFERVKLALLHSLPTFANHFRYFVEIGIEVAAADNVNDVLCDVIHNEEEGSRF